MNIFDIFDRQETGKVISIPVEKIVPSRYQPRIHFDEEAMEELTASIRENGLIQPITVRESGDGYEIIAGERRYRACVKAGFDKIPAYVMSPSEEEAAAEEEAVSEEAVVSEEVVSAEVVSEEEAVPEEAAVTEEALEKAA